MANSARTKPIIRERAAEVSGRLDRAYPDAFCSLTHASPFQLLIATMLSAQCTDARVNMVTPALFKRFPAPADFAAASQEDVEELIRSTGFYRNKAQSIREASRDIVDLHGGEIPSTLEGLTALRGVGRKTANVVLGNAFGVPGMVVDTHVGRISRRLGFTRNDDPEKVEQDLMMLFPPERWVRLGHQMIYLGREFCKAPTPRCAGCPLLDICPFKNKAGLP